MIEPIVMRPKLDAAERARRIACGRGSVRPYERDASIGEIWSRCAAATPDAIAVADDAQALTYGEVERRANRLAHHLIAGGVDAGSAVGVAFDRSVDIPIVLLAILKAGGVYVPLDLSYPRERLDAMIADAAIGVIVCREALDEHLTFTGRTVRLDRDATAISACAQTVPSRPVGADAYAYITYTSGSTGRPKGVMVHQRGVVRLVRNVDYVRIEAHDGFLLHAPLAFDASTFEIWGPLLNGARLGIPRAGLLTVAELAAAVDRFDVTIMFLTTALFGRVVDSALAPFARLGQLLTGGEVASPAHMRRFIETYPHCRLIAVYGPTENTTFSTWCDLPTADAIGTSVPIGRPIANSTAYVVDADGEPAAVGASGELWVGGDGVSGGYANRADLTRERFALDPFDESGIGWIYKTGDRARRRPDGLLEFLGRSDDQVKIRGFRIELGEIESILQAQPSVQTAAVVVGTTGDDKSLVAFVVPQPGSTLSEVALREILATKLPRYMLPHRISIVPALPEHRSGKVDRVALTRAASATSQAASASPAALTSAPVSPARPVGLSGARQRQIQTVVADIWQAALNRDSPPGLDENFFDAGGDSLRLLTVHTQLAARLKADVSILTLFEHTTIRKLTTYLSTFEILR